MAEAHEKSPLITVARKPDAHKFHPMRFYDPEAGGVVMHRGRGPREGGAWGLAGPLKKRAL